MKLKLTKKHTRNLTGKVRNSTNEQTHLYRKQRLCCCLQAMILFTFVQEKMNKFISTKLLPDHPMINNCIYSNFALPANLCTTITSCTQNFINFIQRSRKDWLSFAEKVEWREKLEKLGINQSGNRCVPHCSTAAVHTRENRGEPMHYWLRCPIGF